jgi:hypothetical protein
VQINLDANTELTREVAENLEQLATRLEKSVALEKPINCPIIEVTTCEILIICTGVEDTK